MNLYTDGACSCNPGPGGWAVVIDEPYNINTKYPQLIECNRKSWTTNNEMELSAMLAALKYLFTTDALSDHIIYTDSAYIANTINKGWYRRWRLNGWKTVDKDPVKHEEIWREILYYYELLNITIVHVRGHQSNQYNNLADKYAVMAREGKI